MKTMNTSGKLKRIDCDINYRFPDKQPPYSREQQSHRKSSMTLGWEYFTHCVVLSDCIIQMQRSSFEIDRKFIAMS